VIRLGTRASALALAQAGSVADGLGRAGAEVALVAMRTEGDRRAGERLADAGGKGLFVREIEEALLDGRIDVAVHSLKDLPAEMPDGLELAACPPRADARDVLVTREGGALEALPAGAVVGTGSLRRQALVLALRPDLVVRAIRGNVDTRLRRLADGAWDAVILAAAGLVRLGLVPARAVPLSADVFVPAVGQGILAVQTRRDDARTGALVRVLDDADTRACAVAERAFLARLGASCATPVAGHATLCREGGTPRLAMRALVASEDGRRVLRAESSGTPAEAAAVGRGLADTLLARGAGDVARLEQRRPA
jgi:hydroxymethylbilane synthase